MGKTVRYLGDVPEFDVESTYWSDRRIDQQRAKQKARIKRAARDAVRHSNEDDGHWTSPIHQYLWGNSAQRRRKAR